MNPIVEKLNLGTSTPPSHRFFVEDLTSSSKQPASGELYKYAFRRASQSDIQMGCYRVSPSGESARPARVLQIHNFDFFTVSHFRADSDVFFLTPEGRPVVIKLSGGSFQLRGSVEDTWIVSSWQEFTGGSTPEAFDGGSEVKSLIEPMLAGIPLERSEALKALAREAATQKHRTEEEDIEKWAARLAKDNSSATD